MPVSCSAICASVTIRDMSWIVRIIAPLCLAVLSSCVSRTPTTGEGLPSDATRESRPASSRAWEPTAETGGSTAAVNPPTVEAARPLQLSAADLAAIRALVEEVVSEQAEKRDGRWARHLGRQGLSVKEYVDRLTALVVEKAAAARNQDPSALPWLTALSSQTPTAKPVTRPSWDKAPETLTEYRAYRRAKDGTHVPFQAENGSYWRELSTTTWKPKTTYVRGYFRRDGTYVRGHYRSRP